MKYRIEFDGMCPANYPDNQCNVADQLCPGLGNPGCPVVKMEKCRYDIRVQGGDIEPECNPERIGNPYHKYCPYCGREIEVKND